MISVGTVLRTTGSHYRVLLDDGEILECTLAGKYRLEGTKSTNPIAAGDRVKLNTSKHPAVIEELENRRNYVIRRSTNLSRRTHIIASNLDQMMIVCTVASPRTSTGFIDRLLVTGEAYGVPSILVFNKEDILTDEEKELRDELLEEYTFLGYRTFSVSALTGQGIEDLKSAMAGKTTLISGHSGTGKSSLLNALYPELGLRTGEISKKHQKGTHTTTFAEMHKIPGGGFVIDTPGIKEFGLVHMEDSEIGDYFPEIRSLKEGCRYHNCLHRNEPGCAVLAALDEGGMSEFRYQNYLNIIDSNSYRHWEE